MYAVIETGGKQERVQEGQRLEVELLGRAEGDEASVTLPKGMRRLTILTVS